LAAALAVALPGGLLGQAGLEAILERLDRLEKQNAELRAEVQALRQELEGVRTPVQALEEKVEVQEGRIQEQDQIKLESLQKAPVRVTGMVLFNAFRNSRHGGAADNPTTAGNTRGPVNAGATFRQSVIGLEFDGPEAMRGGRVRGSVMLDLFSGSADALNHQVRLRTGFVEAQWGSRSFLVGQEKPIFAPREPNSLAQVGISPLTAAGNLWRWRPQARFEQRVELGPGSEFRARIGVSQTDERYNPPSPIPADYDATLEPKRPALEGHFQVQHRFDDHRRLEIAPGFHWSSTHIAGGSLPARAFSVDWFVNPHRRVEFTGAMFVGRNLAKLGGGGARQGFTIRRTSGGQVQVIPVRTRGGWAQLTWLPTSRLTFNVQAGQDDPNNADLAPGGIVKNLAYGANVFYRIAPNVVIGVESSQVRTRYVGGQRPLNNHYDLAVAYLF
jgi:uncharacterized protein (UPF0335 family)